MTGQIIWPTCKLGYKMTQTVRQVRCSLSPVLKNKGATKTSKVAPVLKNKGTTRTGKVAPGSRTEKYRGPRQVRVALVRYVLKTKGTTKRRKVTQVP
jgi:hypothetical protein